MKENIELFNNYYKQFDSSLDGVHRKYEHTFRVVDYAKKIAQSLNLSDEDIELAEKCALYHDISRFKQWTDYQTFEDSHSYDHGDMSYEITKELGITDEIILTSIKHHNKYRLPDGLDERTLMFCNITRDADKLDIMMINGRVCNDEELVIPEGTMESFINHELVKNNRDAWNSSVYEILRYLAFIFDMNYKESFKIVKDTDIVNIKCNTILDKFDDERIKQIKDICNKYVDERISD